MRRIFSRLLRFLLVLAITVPVLSLVGALIPGEKVPRVTVLADGTREYVLESLREAVLWPVGSVFVPIVFFGVFLGLEPRDCLERGPGPDVNWPLSAFFLTPFAVLIFFTAVVNPYRWYRAVRVNEREVVFDSLYRSWTVPRSRLIGTRLDRSNTTERCDPDKSPKRVSVSLRLHVTPDDGGDFVSVRIEGLDSHGRMLQECEKFFTRLANDLCPEQQKAAGAGQKAPCKGPVRRFEDRGT